MVGLEIVGEVAKTKPPEPVEEDTLLEVILPHTLDVAESACKTLYCAVGVV
jgi:hypothetical protein